MPGRGFGRGPITARGGRGQPISLSEVKVRVGPVPTDWSFAHTGEGRTFPDWASGRGLCW